MTTKVVSGWNMPLGWKIFFVVLGVLASIALVFLAYCGISALFTGSGFVDTMSNTWCTIFGLTKEATEETAVQASVIK